MCHSSRPPEEATLTTWQPVQLSRPGTRLHCEAGRYQIHLRIPAMFRPGARGIVESWGYQLHSLKPHPKDPSITVADVSLPHPDAITITDWTVRAFRAQS
mgnify:CR=1 FL=1